MAISNYSAPYSLDHTNPGTMVIPGVQGLMRPTYTAAYEEKFGDDLILKEAGGNRDNNDTPKSWDEMTPTEIEAEYDRALGNKGFFDAMNSKLGKAALGLAGSILGAPIGAFAKVAGWMNERTIKEAPDQLAKHGVVRGFAVDQIGLPSNMGVTSPVTANIASYANRNLGGWAASAPVADWSGGTAVRGGGYSTRDGSMGMRGGLGDRGGWGGIDGGRGNDGNGGGNPGGASHSDASGSPSPGGLY